MMNSIEEERGRLRASCTVELKGFSQPTPAQTFQEMAEWAQSNDVTHDVYGEGAFIQHFEAKVAKLLGKQSAVFMPSGVMAQLIAVNIWCERKRLLRFGVHASSHLLLHEKQAYQALMQLHGVTVGHRLRPILSQDLSAVGEPLGCLVIELPAREIGGQLPQWEELVALKKTAAQSGIPLHMDGARLWESKAFYQRSYAEIADGFSSVYVSAYKGLGGIAGALLAGDTDFIQQARLWLRRLGGNLVSQTPMVVSTAMRFDKQLATLEACYQRTLSLAACLQTIPGIRVLPRTPQVNMFHAYFDADIAALLNARDNIARQHGYWLFNNLEGTEVPGWCKTEFYVGDSLLQVNDEQILDLFSELMGQVNKGS
ncbi:threonine aldolase [Enterobacteriaceae bacterium RIT711]|nr:threonine aldolase [Enterobacteriaceae bacterium RIT711]